MRNDAGKALLLAVVAALLYAGTLSHELVWDDRQIVSNVSEVESQHGLWGVFTSDFRLDKPRPTGYYRPLLMLSFLFDNHVSSVLPSAYHLTNLLLHALNTVLAFLLLSLLIPPTGAFAGALLFATHPVLTESVAFAAGRSDLLAASCILVCAICFIRDLRGETSHPWVLRGVGATVFLLGTLFKEVAFALPPVLCGWLAVLSLDNRPTKKDFFGRGLPWISLWLGGGAINLLLRWGLAGTRMPARIGQTSLVLDVPMQLSIWAGYLRLLLCPWPLTAWYAPTDIAPTLVTLAAILILFAASFWAARKDAARVGLLAMIWTAGFLFPAAITAGIRGGAVMAERFLYIPMVGFCLLAGRVIESGVRASRRLALSILLCVFVAAAIATMARVKVWRDEITLFSTTLGGSPQVAILQGFLGNAYFNVGRYGDAVEAFRKMTELAPAEANGWYCLGNSYFKMNKLDEAVAAYLHAIEAGKGLFPEAYNNLGTAYLLLGREREAREAFARAMIPNGQP